MELPFLGEPDGVPCVPWNSPFWANQMGSVCSMELPFMGEPDGVRVFHGTPLFDSLIYDLIFSYLVFKQVI